MWDGQAYVTKRSAQQPAAHAPESPGQGPGDSAIPLEDSKSGSTAHLGSVDPQGNGSPGGASGHNRRHTDAREASHTARASDSKGKSASNAPDASAGDSGSDSAATGSSLSGRSSSDSIGSGTTTGGFETMLGKMVVKTGLVSTEEIESFSNLLKQSEQQGEPRTLSELLIENDLITERQLSRLRSDFETKKSTRSIPGYKMLEKLGSGAMATVFLAKQLSLDRKVAIKVLPKKFSDNQDFIERFYKEGRAAAQLNHPNIVQAYDVGRAGDHHYFVMEYVDGPTVYDRLVKDKIFRGKDAIEVIRQVALALQHAHERGFIHRDIKPKNIMITRAGVVKLADLGLARAMSDKDAAAAEAGRAYGTPYYISPEQIRGEVSIGPPADIYGLGATFYHMVTGKVPFEGKNPSEVMRRHLKAELVPPDHINTRLSAGTAQVIEMMMAKDPAERYQNVTDLLEDLELIARGEAPHFAHKTLDLGDIATVISGPAPEAAAPQPTPAQRSASGATSDPKFMILMVVAAASVVINLILLLLLLT